MGNLLNLTWNPLDFMKELTGNGNTYRLCFFAPRYSKVRSHFSASLSSIHMPLPRWQLVSEAYLHIQWSVLNVRVTKDNVYCRFIYLFVSFQAYAAGCDIVILASDFQRVQIIPGAIHGNIQVTCIDCCADSGKVSNMLICVRNKGSFTYSDCDCKSDIANVGS